MTYVLRKIDDLSEVLNLWPTIKERLSRALAYSNDGSKIEDIIVSIVEGSAQLWTISSEDKILNIFVTELNDEEPKDVLNFYLLEAESLATINGEILCQVLEWAKSRGAKRAELLGRPGWERVMKKFGFNKTHVLMSKEL